MTQRILVVDDSQMNLKIAVATLQQAGYELSTAQGGREALEQVGRFKPDLIVLDVTMPDLSGYDVCRRLRRMPDFAQIPIMMLTANDTIEERINGLEAGADDYMVKPFAPPELQARVRALLRRSTPERTVSTRARGKVTALFSLRGGTGVSTMATNVAVALSQIWGCQSILVDLAFASGQSALMLNLPIRTSWANLAQLQPDEVEEAMLDRLLLSHASGTQLLAAPARLEQNELITAELVSHVVGMLRHRTPYVVLDLAHTFDDRSLAGLDAADQIMLMITPDLAGVRAAFSALEVFSQLEYSAEKVALVLNNTIERGGLARKDIEATLKRPISAVLPFASEALVSALNRGVPPVYEAPGKGVGAVLEEWAFSLSNEEQRQQRPERPTEAWQRVVQRAQQRRGR